MSSDNSTESAQQRTHLDEASIAGGQKKEFGRGYNGSEIGRQTTYGGHVAQNELHALPQYHRKSANAMPLGMFSFATTLLLLSLYNVGARGVSVPNGAVTFALGFGGVTQLASGMLEFASGNSYGATVFTSYALFWWGYAMLYIPFFGITGSYDGAPGAYTATGQGALEVEAAFGIFFITWFSVSMVLTLASIRSSIAVLVWIVAWDITLVLLAVSSWFPEMPKILTGAGAVGCVTSAAAYYVGLAGLLTKESSYFLLPMGLLSRKD
ncbi:uncharacterized protein P7C70_g5929, partial [Phenoliferia sp. Uapishka_3]